MGKKTVGRRRVKTVNDFSKPLALNIDAMDREANRQTSARTGVQNTQIGKMVKRSRKGLRQHG